MSLKAHLAAAVESEAAGNSVAAVEVESGYFAPFVPTPAEQFGRLVALGSIEPGDVVCDLGFGDGALLCGLVKLAGCTGCGCEVDAALVVRARALAASSGLTAHVVMLTESPIARRLARYEPK